MKVVIAYIEPSLTEKIAEALAGIGIIGATATDAREFGPGEFRPINYRGVESEQPYSKETQLEVITQDNRVNEVVEMIKSIATQSDFPKVKILVKSMDDTIRIRDGSHGDEIL